MQSLQVAADGAAYLCNDRRRDRLTPRSRANACSLSRMISLISAASSFCRRANPSKFLPQGLMLSERLRVRPCQSPPSRLEGFGLSGQRRAVGFFVPLASLHFRWQSYTFTCTSYHMAGKISTEQHMAKGLTTAKGALARATLDECEDDARARQLRAANFNRIASLRSASARHGTAALKATRITARYVKQFLVMEASAQLYVSCKKGQFA